MLEVLGGSRSTRYGTLSLSTPYFLHNCSMYFETRRIYICGGDQRACEVHSIGTNRCKAHGPYGTSGNFYIDSNFMGSYDLGKHRFLGSKSLKISPQLLDKCYQY